MVDTLRYKEWIEKAERDIKSAKILKEHECGNDEAEELIKIAEEIYGVVISKL